MGEFEKPGESATPHCDLKDILEVTHSKNCLPG